MTRTQPLQSRSRDRVEQILLAATELIEESGSAEALTTTAVAVRTEMSVATVYRYFDDRHAIIVALLDREFEKLVRSVVEELRGRKRVSVDELLALIICVHLEYFRGSRTAIPLWYSTRGALSVERHIAEQLGGLARWISQSSVEAGLIRADAPDWGVEPLVWICDQVFRYIFLQQRDAREQDQILGMVQKMLAGQVRKFATTQGREGMAATEIAEVAEKTLLEFVQSGRSDRP